MKNALACLFLLCLSPLAFAVDSSTGFQTITLPNTEKNRPLELAIWYPAASNFAKPELIADNVVFIGALGVPDAAPAAASIRWWCFPDGYGGNWGKQVWLASALAHNGYIVAAVNHPGTTSKDRSPAAAAQLWQRPADLSRAIDAVLAQPKQFGAVANNRITAIGHSLGGWTVMEIAGARFDPDLFSRDCNVHPKLGGCVGYQQMNPARTPDGKAKLAVDLRDKRVTAWCPWTWACHAA